MTNRDAINLLEEVKMLDDTMYAYNPCYEEALDMALTASEAEDPWYATHEYEKWNIDPDAVIPTIEPKKGKWISKADQRWHCSLCDGIAPKGYRWNYCPDCGADMREGAD